MEKSTTSEYGYEETRKSKIKTLKFEKDKKSGDVFVYVNSKKLSLDKLSLEEFSILKEEAVYKMKEISPEDRNGTFHQRIFTPIMIGWGTGIVISNIINFQSPISIIKLLIVGGITLGFVVSFIKNTIKQFKASKMYYDCKQIVDICEEIHGVKEFLVEVTKQIFGEEVEITEFKKISREDFESQFLKEFSNDNFEENDEDGDENE